MPVIFLARDLTLNILLTLQPPSLEASSKIVGADVLTPAHEGSRRSTKRHARPDQRVPPYCLSGSPPERRHRFGACDCAGVDLPGLTRRCLRSAVPPGRRGLSCLGAVLRLLLRSSVLVYGLVCSVVFRTFSSSGNGSVALAGLALLAFFLAIPATTFAYLYVSTSGGIKVVHPILRHHIKHVKRRAWWYRHSWQALIFSLALDDAVFASRARADSQIASSAMGLFSVACMASVLLGVRPYEVDFRWMDGAASS